MPDARIDALSTVPLFSHLSARHLRKVLARTVENDFEEGAVIVREGGHGETLFVILEGTAKVVRKGRTIALRTEGEFFGEISVIDGPRRTATVIAETPMRCLVLYRRELKQLVMSEPQAAWAILEAVAASVREG